MCPLVVDMLGTQTSSRRTQGEDEGDVSMWLWCPAEPGRKEVPAAAGITGRTVAAAGTRLPGPAGGPGAEEGSHGRGLEEAACRVP